MSHDYSIGEAMIAAIARTIEDGSLVFHGYGSPLVQLAMYVAKRTHAPNMVLVAGASYGVNPDPPFLTPTSNDWVMDRGAACSLDIEQLFDLAAAGRMGRMFLSGLQIDKWGNCNVTRLGGTEVKMKLPGGGGGCNLSCDTQQVTLWTTGHRAAADSSGKRRYRLVEACDFVTSLGHRSVDGHRRAELGHIGGGPQWLVTELGLFDFAAGGHMRMRALFPDVSVEDVLASTEFVPDIAANATTIPAPDAEAVSIVRRLDPLRIHERELRPEDRHRRFAA
jgi:glutaconate CoA-transferase, subunit B